MKKVGEQLLDLFPVPPDSQFLGFIGSSHGDLLPEDFFLDHFDGLVDHFPEGEILRADRRFIRGRTRGSQQLIDSDDQSVDVAEAGPEALFLFDGNRPQSSLQDHLGVPLHGDQGGLEFVGNIGEQFGGFGPWCYFRGFNRWGRLPGFGLILLRWIFGDRRPVPGTNRNRHGCRPRDRIPQTGQSHLSPPVSHPGRIHDHPAGRFSPPFEDPERELALGDFRPLKSFELIENLQKILGCHEIPQSFPCQIRRFPSHPFGEIPAGATDPIPR